MKMKGIAGPFLCAACRDLSDQGAAIVRIKSHILFSRPQCRTFSVSMRSKDRPFRMAVIGSGPAGFYTSYKVMSKIENSKVDMYEQLPVPYGLVRFGVAPDHPEVKNCEEKFQEVAESPNFNFIGNVAIGEGNNSISLKSLMPHYDALLFAYGASRDRLLGIPGENSLLGVHSARAFVGWYNGLPEYTEIFPDLTQGEEAVVIGQGNVALDIARILLTDVDHLRTTDISSHALEILSRSRIKKVRVVGRRGPLQAAFTIKEIRELMNLPYTQFAGLNRDLVPADTSSLSRAPRRLMELLAKGSPTSPDSASKSWSLDFCLSPKSFDNKKDSPQRLSGMTFEGTSLQPDAFDPRAKAMGTGEAVQFPASVAFRSIGYKSEALEGFADIGVPFDNALGLIPNDMLGRVRDIGDSHEKHKPGVYCAGWVKRGPTGVIASTMTDAFATADAIVDDWHSSAPFLNPVGSGVPTARGWDAIKEVAETNGCRRVSWKDWKRIDMTEKERGRRKGKEREKITNVEDMLTVLD